VAFGQIGKMGALQSQERSIQNEKRGGSKKPRRFPTEGSVFFQKTGTIAERPEPEQVYVNKDREVRPPKKITARMTRMMIKKRRRLRGAAAASAASQ